MLPPGLSVACASKIPAENDSALLAVNFQDEYKPGRRHGELPAGDIIALPSPTSREFQKVPLSCKLERYRLWVHADRAGLFSRISA